MATPCKVAYDNGKLVCYLPVAKPTGKVRVLRGDRPVFTRRDPLSQDDTIEWQISYFADGHSRLVELGELLNLAFQNNIVNRNQLRKLRSSIEKQQEFFADRYSITIPTDPAGSSSMRFYDFTVLKKTVPVLVKNVDDVTIWIELKHKQKAVGFQPMLYLRIPIQSVSPSLLGRCASLKQEVTWHPTWKILFETVKAFSVASSKHRQDMIEVLGQVLNE
jgi:hypothetical protein